MTYLLLGLTTLFVVAIWMMRAMNRQRDEASGAACPECGGDLRGYEESFTCPHCYAVLDEEDHHDDEGASIDEDEEWDEDDDAQPL
jgi:transcription initiation factor IIE alpha subunit